MKRLLVLSMLCLATAGCAQSKGALLRGASYPPSPVALTPVPSIYDTVNTGVGGDQVAQTAIQNPADPQWSGRAQLSTAARPVPAGAPGQAGGFISAPASSGAPATTGLAVAQPQPALAPPQIGAAPALAPLPVASALPPSGGQGSALLPANPADTLLPTQAPAPELAAAPEPASPSPLPSPSPMPNPAPAPVAMAAAPAAAATATSPRVPRGRDPLLGPEPDLLPSMPELPPAVASAPQPAPLVNPAPAENAPTSSKLAPPPVSPPPIESLPALAPAISPQPGPAESAAPPPIDLPIEADKSTSSSRPVSTGLASVGLSLEAAPSDTPLSRPGGRGPGASAGPDGRIDRDVVQASANVAKKPRKDRKSVYEDRGPVARVGDEIITFQDLRAAVRENLDKYPELRGDGFNSAQQMQINQDREFLAKQTLTSLIDRSLLAQEAKRHIKDKTMIDRLYEEADKIWHEQDVLPLQRLYKVDTDAKLKEALAEEGRSLDQMRTAFRQYFLAESFLHDKLKDRIKVELPDLLRFYNEHLQGHEFDRPAQITWRELVVEGPKYKTREEARAKADLLLEKLRRGADFSQLARTESDGPSSSRKEGGLMKTTPGSYAVKSINDALDSLPIGQTSGVIEAPESFHIVRVEARRPAGPASFAEIQDKIKPLLENQKYRDERIAYVSKLQKNTLISVSLGADEPGKRTR